MVICFDIDGVLCNQVEYEYGEAKPNREMIALVNRLYERGIRIILNTSRFMGRTGGDAAAAHHLGYEFTRTQLAAWGVHYHELHMGKPKYDILIDDRSVFYEPNCQKIEALIEKKIQVAKSG